MSFERKGNLPRLERHHYQAHAVVFWTNTLEGRARGWLTPAFHSAFRELMLHSAARENFYCPAYILMPDHLKRHSCLSPELYEASFGAVSIRWMPAPSHGGRVLNKTASTRPLFLIRSEAFKCTLNS